MEDKKFDLEVLNERDAQNAKRRAERAAARKAADDRLHRLKDRAGEIFVDPFRPSCPFCGNVAMRSSQGDWPVVYCRHCEVTVELHLLETPEIKR